MKKTEPLYVITGVSRLTGLREECSTPVHESTAKKLLAKWKTVPARKRDYLWLKMQVKSPSLFK